MFIKRIIIIGFCFIFIADTSFASCIPVGETCPCTTYRCNAGYYGDGTTCTSCATATGNANATSAKGTTLITGCYVPSGTNGSDTIGSWTIVGGTCPYVL